MDLHANLKNTVDLETGDVVIHPGGGTYEITGRDDTYIWCRELGLQEPYARIADAAGERAVLDETSTEYLRGVHAYDGDN